MKMRISILLLCCLSLLDAAIPVTINYSITLSFNGKLVASTLQAQTAYQSVKEDNNLLEQALKLSGNPQATVGVKRFVEKASEHAADVADVCLGLKNVLMEVESATDWSSIVGNVKQACDSREALNTALNYWSENEDFISENIPTAVEYLDSSRRPVIESCVSALSTISV
jgi:hypothetical protein